MKLNLNINNFTNFSIIDTYFENIKIKEGFMKKIGFKDIKIISQLLKSKNYDEIYKRYGKFMYKLFEISRISQEVKYEGGKNFDDLKQIIDVHLKEIVYFCIIYLSYLFLAMPNDVQKDIKATARNENIDRISEYERYVDDYLESIDFTGLSDLEIFMKLMQYEHQEMLYGTPEQEITGYYRVQMLDGKGVCRNIADDLAYRLNLINPEYNAKMICVNSSYGNWVKNDDKMQIDPDYNFNNEEIDKDSKGLEEIKKRLFPNHAVTMINIPGEDYSLILDPTNSGIGVISNGKIDMFNSDNENYYVTELSNALLMGYDIRFSTELNELKSYFTKHSLEELNELYGLDAQNEAIKKLDLLN